MIPFVLALSGLIGCAPMDVVGVWEGVTDTCVHDSDGVPIVLDITLDETDERFAWVHFGDPKCTPPELIDVDATYFNVYFESSCVEGSPRDFDLNVSDGAYERLVGSIAWDYELCEIVLFREGTGDSLLRVFWE